MIAVFVLAACQSSTPVEPTLDANAVYTQAAATVAAGLAETQAGQPTATQAPATDTPAPTVAQTSEATAAEPGPDNSTPGAGGSTDTTPGAPTATLLSLTVVPTNTAAASGETSLPDKGEWVSQYPPDNTQMPINEKFNVKYVFKNTGTTTWTTSYLLRFYAGDKLGGPDDLNMTKEVEPGKTVEVLFEVTAPAKAGKTHTIWTLTNADGQNFYYAYLDLEFVEQ
jgi:hypothetical protein